MTRRLLFFCFLALALFGVPSAVGAQQSGAPPNLSKLSPAEAQELIDLLQDPRHRAQLIETLRAIAKSPPSAEAKPATEQAPALTLAPNGLGAQLLSQISGWPEALAGEAAVTIKAITDFPLLWSWGTRLTADPDERLAALNGLWQLTLVVVSVLLIEWLARRALAQPTTALAAHVAKRDLANGSGGTDARHIGRAWTLLRRLPVALARLLLDLIPVGVFWAAGSLFAGLVASPLTRAAILIIVNAYAAARVVIAVGEMLMAPASGRLRLVGIGDEDARSLIRWLRRLTFVVAIGASLANLALLFGLSGDAYAALIRIVGLIVAVLLGILVLRSRRTLAQRLSAGSDLDGGNGRWRNWLAAAVPYVALIAIVAGWIVWAAGIHNGLGGLRLLIGTVAILVAARLAAIIAFGVLDRASRLSPGLTRRLPGAASRAAYYEAPARAILRVLIVAATAIALLQLWGANAFLWFAPDRIGGRLVAALVTVAIAAVAAIIVWEGSNAALERRLVRLSEAESAAHAARLRSLMPMLRAALLSVILLVVGLTALSEIGVNIAPLLAGASIVGIAVGFGAQKLVQDVITGMFVLLENAIQIGDWVTVAGLSGTVERLSVRNIWLRSNDGAVHIVPFSAVTSITNTNRGLGNASITVTVAYSEDSDRVAGTLRQIAGEMRSDPDFAPLVLGDLEIWVDAVKASGVTLAGLIACSDAGRWPVQHEFNRRLQKRFQELGIELAGG